MNETFLRVFKGSGLGLISAAFAFSAHADVCVSEQNREGVRVAAPSLAGMQCERKQVSGTRDELVCLLEYPFRSDAARASYDKFVAEFRSCLGSDAEVSVGPSVNHPDSYDQTLFVGNGRQTSVALKDKGALQKTYVFVRVPAN